MNSPNKCRWPHHECGVEETAMPVMEIEVFVSGPITGWHKKGWLKATLREPGHVSQKGGGLKWFSREEVRHFVVETIEVIDLPKVDKFWLIELLAGGENAQPADLPERTPAPRSAMTLEAAADTIQSALAGANTARINPLATSLHMSLHHLRRALELRKNP